MLTVALCSHERSGNGIIRVDITADGGKSWTSANLQHHELGQKRGRCTGCIGEVSGIVVTVVCLHLPDAYASRRCSAKQGCQHESCFCGVRSEWAWTLWDVTLPLKKADRSKPLQLAVRAVDAAYNAQPEVTSLCKTCGAGCNLCSRCMSYVSAHATRRRWTLTVEALLFSDVQSAAPIWNLRGVLCNSWHRVELDWRNESDVGQVSFRAELAQQLCIRFVIAGQH